MAIFLALVEKSRETITIPSIIPPVVANAILCSGHGLNYRDDVNWVGNSYILHQFEDYKVIDSAQQLTENQFKEQANDEDLMIFSFYPTKPVGSSDGGLIVSNDKEKIDRLRILSRNGMSLEKNSWERNILLPGWKMYMNSIQAYIANENFKKLESKTKRYNEIREIYNEAFGKNNTSLHLYRLNVDNNDTVVSSMKERGIQCGIHYKAIHLMGAYSRPALDLPLSEQESKTTISIPYHEMLTDEQIETVIKEIKNVI
tara:strand:- start:2569 stop:3342 length:774 start_codon:yes stop_codon:yes gene_type:complete